MTIGKECPYCNGDVVIDDCCTIEDGAGMNLARIGWIGHCLDCEKVFSWVDTITVEHSTELEEN